MKLRSKIFAGMLLAIMLICNIPTSVFASTYTVTLCSGPEGKGESVTLTKIAGQPLSLAHTRATVTSKYGFEPAGGSTDQRFFIKWATGYDEETGRGTGSDYYDVYNNDADVTLYAIWGYEVVYNADGGVFPDGSTKYEDYVCNFNSTDYDDPKSVYGLHGFPQGENAPVKEGCRRVVMSSGADFFALLKTTMYMYTTETAEQNLTIPPTGGTMEWKTFRCTTTSRGNTAIEFYAVWEPSVTYCPNGASGEEYTEYLDWNWSRLWRYESYTIDENSFSYDGATFTGWNTKPDGSGKSYTAGRKLNYFANNSDPVTLYAQWEIMSHTHSYTVTREKEPTCGLEGLDVYTCECGSTYTEKVPATGRHDYSFTVTEPTCSNEGYIVYTCECGDTCTETIPATGEHDYEITVIDPTCNEDGKIINTCVCGNTVIDTIPATGEHDYRITTIEPTCTEEGAFIYTCSVCNHNYEEKIPATAIHEYKVAESVIADCVTDGYMLYICEICGKTERESVAAIGHNWSNWVETTAPTSTSVGIETRYCSNCDYNETREIPMLETNASVISDVNNYTVTIKNMNNIKEVRFAIGTYTTGSEVKAAEKNVTLDAGTVAKYTVDGTFTYDLPWIGTYTFWVRYTDGTAAFLYTDVADIAPYVTSYGVKLTVNDFGENYKDAWLAKGTFNSYSEIKASTAFKYQASATKLANYAKTTHDFTYTMEDPGDYTVLIRYNDGTVDVIHHTLTVTTPVLVENGLQAIITNIPDIKIIRTAYGHYTDVAGIKKASTVRYFNNKTAIKDAEEYMIQYRDEGEVTIIVEYNDGYKHYFYYNVAKKVPTVVQSGDTVTFGNLDDMYIIRYAAGKYSTANNIKNAPGAQYKRSDAINENGEIVLSGLTTGRWSFMVQYYDDSFNFYLLDIVVE